MPIAASCSYTSSSAISAAPVEIQRAIKAGRSHAHAQQFPNPPWDGLELLYDRTILLTATRLVATRSSSACYFDERGSCDVQDNGCSEVAYRSRARPRHVYMPLQENRRNSGWAIPDA